MINIIGNSCLILIILICLINSFLIYFKPQIYKIASKILFFTGLFCFLNLIYGFIISDFSVENVYLNSHQLKPLIYKISGSWGNHEGSLILIIFVKIIYVNLFNIFSKIDEKIKLYANIIAYIIIMSFTSYIFFTSNPFRIISPTPSEGLGLNPLLQDIALAIHPPILYFGYGGFIIPFAVTLALLINSSTNTFGRNLKPWINISWSFLTLGIGLGSWWAYRELGWGGFWFWDPIENISLIPWLAATSLLHIVIVNIKRKIFDSWFKLLSILTYIFSLLGTFLVRSGIITSVHSFATDPDRGIYLIILISLISLFSLLIYITKNKSLPDKFKVNSRESLIFLNNIFLLSGALIITLAILYPVFSYIVFNQAVSVGELYYEKTFLPLMLPILLFASIGMIIAWKENKIKLYLPKFISTLFLSSILLLLVREIYGSTTFFGTLGLLFSLNLIITTLLKYLTFKNKNYALILGHLGFGLLIFAAIIAFKYSTYYEANLKLHSETSFNHNNIKFLNIKYSHGKNYLSQIAQIKISNDVKSIILEPEVRLYPIEKTTISEAAIKHYIFEDLYIVTGSYDTTTNSLFIRFYERKFINFIWLSVILLGISGILSFKNKKYKFTLS
ncbi:MAG: heme lyase CcmF/NrfE family subunit [Sphingobacteriia bacterium]|nr:heme lyase CcmF/NrfE family subunit [Sphingobacteriia bacterium]